MVIVTIALTGWYVGFWGRERSTARALMGANPSINPVDATATLCIEPRCEEGWRTDLGDYLRFASEGEAEYWETVLGDMGRRYGRYVLDMRAVNLTFDQRRKAIDILFSAKDWS